MAESGGNVCWADWRPANNSEESAVSWWAGECRKAPVSELGLCEEHYLEMVGLERGERMGLNFSEKALREELERKVGRGRSTL